MKCPIWLASSMVGMAVWASTFDPAEAQQQQQQQQQEITKIVQSIYEAKHTAEENCNLILHGLDSSFVISDMLTSLQKSALILDLPEVNDQGPEASPAGPKVEALSSFLHAKASCVFLVAQYKFRPGQREQREQDLLLERLGKIVERVGKKNVVLVVQDDDMGASDALDKLGKDLARIICPVVVVRLKKGQQGAPIPLHLSCPSAPFKPNVNLWLSGSGSGSGRFALPLKSPANQCPHPLSGQHLNVSCKGLPPFNIWRGGKVIGVDVDLMDILARKFKFTYSVKTETVMGKKFGHSEEWEGVVGSVKNGTSAIGIGNPALDPARYSAVDYTTMLYTIDTVYIAPVPRPTPPYQNLLKPFSLPVWLLYLATLLVVTAAMVLVAAGSASAADISTESLLKQAVLFPYASLMRQNPNELPFRHASTEFLMTFWVLFVLISTLAYSCNLRAFLVAIDYERPIDSGQDILDLGRKFYIPVGTSLESSLVNSPALVNKELVKVTERRNGYFILQKGWLPKDLEEEMLNGGGAFLFPKEPVQMNYYKFQKAFGYQPFRISKEVGFSYHAGFLLPKYVSWKRDLDQTLESLVGMGFIKKLKRDYYPLPTLLGSQAGGSRDNLDASRVKFSLEHLLGAYVILGAGLLLGGLIFALEGIVGRKRE